MGKLEGVEHIHSLFDIKIIIKIGYVFNGVIRRHPAREIGLFGKIGDQRFCLCAGPSAGYEHFAAVIVDKSR